MTTIPATHTNHTFVSTGTAIDRYLRISNHANDVDLSNMARAIVNEIGEMPNDTLVEEWMIADIVTEIVYGDAFYYNLNAGNLRANHEFLTNAGMELFL